MGRRKKLPYILEEEEQKELLAVFNTRYPTQVRNKTMIKLMLDSGLRLSEAVNLKWKHINLMSGKLEVKEGKGAKDRVVYIGERTLEQLKEWRDRQAEKLKEKVRDNKGLVFTTLSGNKLNQGNVRKMVYKYAEKSGIQEYEIKENNNGKEYKERKVTPHTLRHTFATDLYRDNGNIRLVQKALGHSDLSTTMIYTHIVDEELENAMKNFRSK